jgi:hypothetical protein
MIADLINLIGPLASWIICEYGPVACVLVGLVAAGIGFAGVARSTWKMLE